MFFIVLCMKIFRVYVKYGQNVSSKVEQFIIYVIYVKFFSMVFFLFVFFFFIFCCYEINKIYFLVVEVIKDMKFNLIFFCGGFGFCGVFDIFINEVYNCFDFIGFIVVFNNVGIDILGFGKFFKMK